jgi:hypothetical protein
MGMFNLSQPYSGNFYEAEYLEYDERTKKYLPPKHIRVKPKTDGSQGVSTNVKERTRVQLDGRWVEKLTFTVETIESYSYKLKDKIKINYEDKMYTIWKVTDGVDSLNSIANLMFPKIKTNKPYVLYLGSD